MKNYRIRSKSRAPWLTTFIALWLLFWASGCSSIFGPESDADATPTLTPTQVYAAVPTYTPTVAVVAPPTPTAQRALAPTLAPTVTVAAAIPLTTTVEGIALATGAITDATTVSVPVIALVPTTTAAPAVPQLTVSADVANIRSGPGTTFTLVASVIKGDRFEVTARTPAGDWWQLCCVNGQSGWIFGELVSVEAGELVAIANELPTPAQSTPVAVAVAPVATVADTQPTTAPVSEPTIAPPPASNDPSAGDFNPEAQYQIVNFRVLGLNENNGGIRDSRAQHHIFLAVLDQGGNGVDGVVVENLVGEKGQIVTGDKGPGKAEITMYYEPFKLRVVTDPSGAVTSQTSNQMGLAFPHLPDIVGKLGGLDYEYAVCPTIDVKCSWPIQAVHFSYEITFQKLR